MSPGSTPLSDPDAPLDPQVLALLRGLAAQDGADLLGELADFFIGELAPRIEGIRSGLVAADPVVVSQWAHSLKGSADNLGASRLAAVSADRAEARRGSTTKSVALLPALEAEARRVRSALEEACPERS